MTEQSTFAKAFALAVSIAALSCGSDNTGPKPSDAGAPDGPTQPLVGGKLGAALASAAAAANSAGPSAKGKSGDPSAPPENGVYGPGEADKALPRDKTPKVDVIAEGVDPKVNFAMKLDAPELKTVVAVGIRINQSQLPPLDFALAIKPDKPKGDKGDKGTEKPKDGTPSGPTHMAATVTGVTVSAAGAPKEFADTVAKFKGTVVRYDLTSTGAATGFAVEAPKDAGEGLELVLDALLDAVSMWNVPLPSKPIGKGGYWIVGDRAKAAAGIELLRYRVFTVQDVTDAGVTLSMDIRQYSADQKIKLDAGGGSKTEYGIEAFESQGKGTLVWKADSFLPLRGDFSEKVAAKLGGAGAPQGRGAPVVQTQVTGSIGGGAAAPPASSAAPGKKP